MLRFFYTISITILMLSSGRAQNLFPILGGQRAGTSVFTFLNIGVSARAVGMGESVVALNQDAASIYYNPAVIAQLDQTEISMSQIQWPSHVRRGRSGPRLRAGRGAGYPTRAGSNCARSDVGAWPADV